jgi:glycosyltransferase involved in cell wall biosynthesis
MARILSFSTYPVVRPLHGGQRRVSAFGDFYRSLGHEFHYACVYEPASYGPGTVTSFDHPLIEPDPRWNGVPLINDLLAGDYAARSPLAYAHFRGVVDRVRPDVVQLDHPFMLPLFRRLREEGVLGAQPLIYSSHNWEPPLKEEMLRRAGVTTAVARDVRRQVEELERESVAAAEVVVAVSAHDAEAYRRLRSNMQVVVVPNGVSRPPAEIPDIPALELFGREKLLFFVGSAYPPNIEGFCDLVADGGLFFMPPLQQMAVCGGVSDGIFNHPKYQQFLHANSARVQFFQNPTDPELWSLKRRAHVMMLPIAFGGGSNLKTAEALVAGKWLVATPTALRGFEAFAGAPGVVVAENRDAFRRALAETLRLAPLELDEAELRRREALYWDRGFADSGLRERLAALLPALSAAGAVVAGEVR